MKKIAFIIRNLAGGGVERTLFNLIEAIDKTKFEIYLLVFENTGKMKSEIPKCVNVIDLSLTNYLFARVNFKSKEKFYDLIKSGHFMQALNLYIFDRKSNAVANKRGAVGMYELYKKYIPEYPDSFDLAVDFYGYGDYTGVYVIDKINANKKVTWIHDEKQQWIKGMKSYYPRFDAIFACSQQCVNNFVNVFPELKDRVDVFYNLIPVDKIKQMAKLDSPIFSNKTNLVTVGRLSRQKGYDIAIKAAQIIKSQDIKFTWYFVGAGLEEDSLRELAKECQVENEIVFCGFDLNPYRYMRNCDIYVQPSRHEGYCTTITEAFILGKVIVASDVSGVREQIEDGITGVILPDLNSDCLANTLCNLIKNKKYCDSISANVSLRNIDFNAELEKIYKIIDMK